MLELAEDASQVLQQLNTTVQSYENLMEKLEVDISVIEKEKEKIIELMEDAHVIGYSRCSSILYSLICTLPIPTTVS